MRKSPRFRIPAALYATTLALAIPSCTTCQRLSAAAAGAGIAAGATNDEDARKALTLIAAGLGVAAVNSCYQASQNQIAAAENRGSSRSKRYTSRGGSKGGASRYETVVVPNEERADRKFDRGSDSSARPIMVWDNEQNKVVGSHVYEVDPNQAEKKGGKNYVQLDGKDVEVVL